MNRTGILMQLVYGIVPTNPFSIYCVSWILVLLTYGLNWSNIFPELSVELLLFLLLTSIIAYFVSVLCRARCYIDLGIIKSRYRQPSLRMLFILELVLTILLLFEFAVCGVPIRNYILHLAANSDYMSFGLPVVNVVVVNGFSVVFLLAFVIRFIYPEKKKQLRWAFIMPALSPLLCMQRGILLNMIAAATMLYFFQTKNKIKKVALLSVFGCAILFLFGYIGQVRMQGKDDLILEIGGAKREFIKGDVPHEFFWPYLYIASPLANLQSELNKENDSDSDLKGVRAFVLSNIVPQFISKYFSKKVPTYKYDVSPPLVVGSTYYVPYYQLGWIGVMLMFVYMMIFFRLSLFIVPKQSIMFPVLLAVLSNMSLFSIFDNMVAYSGMFPQLILIYLIDKIYARW